MMMCVWLAHCCGFIAGSGATGKGLSFKRDWDFSLWCLPQSYTVSCGLIMRNLDKIDEMLNFRAIVGFSS